MQNARPGPVLCILLLLLAPAVGQGSAPDSSAAAATSELARILAEIETSTLLKVRTREQKILQGELVRRDADSFVLGVDVLDDVSIDTNRIETLWIAAGNKSAQGTLWGALIGGGVGTLFWTAMFTGGFQNGAEIGVLRHGLFFGLVTGVPTGAIVGGMIGGDYHDWREAYPEPPLAPRNGSP